MNYKEFMAGDMTPGDVKLDLKNGNSFTKPNREQQMKHTAKWAQARYKLNDVFPSDKG